MVNLLTKRGIGKKTREETKLGRKHFPDLPYLNLYIGINEKFKEVNGYKFKTQQDVMK